MAIDPKTTSPRNLLRIPWTDRHNTALIYVILLLGAYLRINRYLFNRSLWLDEAYLALNIIELTPAQLLGKLAYGQVAPIGFLVPAKALATALGPQETVLRLIPLLSGIVSLILFHRLARKWLPSSILALAVLLFATSDALADYAAQFKQYSSDAAITLILLLTAIWFLEQQQSGKRYLVLAAVGSVAVLASHPASIVLAGIGAPLILLSLQRRSYSESLRLLGIAACWLGSFALTYILSIQPTLHSQSLLSFWEYHGGFLPMPPTSIADIEAAIGILVQPFEEPLGFALYSGVVLLFAIGAIDAIREGGQKLFLITPLVVVVALSALRLYPLSGRLLLFAVPLMLLIVAMGILRVCRALMARSSIDRAFVLAVIGLIAFQPLRTGLARGLNPRAREEMRPIMRLLMDRYEPGDTVAVYYAAQYAYKYYAYLLRWNQPDPVIIQSHGDAPEEYYQEVDQLRGNGRVWIVFSHKMAGQWGAEEQVILNYLDDVGRQIDGFHETGASLYLYDLADQARVPSS